MGHESRLWEATRITLTPTGSGRSYGVEVKDESGSTLAACDAEGTIRDAAGEAILTAPLHWEGRGNKATDVRVDFADAGGSALGTGRVTKYGVGPRAKKATVEVVDAGGVTALRLEPRDGRGQELALTAGDSALATVAVEQVKTGFMRKSRVYTVVLADGVTQDVRPLALATAIRYDAVLNAVVSAVASDRD